MNDGRRGISFVQPAAPQRSSRGRARAARREARESERTLQGTLGGRTARRAPLKRPAPSTQEHPS